VSRPLSRLLKHSSSLSFGGGQGFVVPPFWQNETLHNPRMSFSSSSGNEERLETSFESYVQQAYKSNGIVFACIQARQLPFSEALFRRQAMDDGVPGALSYDSGLDLLERPWPNGTTGELLSRMEQDASLAGNSYWTIVGTGDDARLRRLRPDWVTIITGVRGDRNGSPYDIDADVIGYVYAPKPRNRAEHPEPVFLTVDRVVHYSPVPDPEAQWRGMSWLTPVLREIDGDSAATRHKLKFFENGATSNFIVTYDASITPENFQASVKAFNDAHRGVDMAYKTIHLGGGSDAKTVGADLKQIDFKATQGAGETRIAAAAGVGAIIGQFSEGMQGSSLNAGNYSSARRRFADMTLRPLWRMAAGSLEKFTKNPAGSRLWYADKHIDFLQEDAKDAADIFAVQANAYRSLVDSGADPVTVRDAISAGNISLVEHTGKLSVQLWDPDAQVDPSREQTP
jgi:phage portal protein BeeE